MGTPADRPEGSSASTGTGRVPTEQIAPSSPPENAYLLDPVSEQDEITGETLAAISRQMVRLKAEHYGKGATEAKAYVCDDWLFCVLKGGMTPVERTLLQNGEGALVRQVRLRFQETMGTSFTGAVEEETGRPVLTYQSQVLFDPDFTVEIFLLGRPNADG